MDACFSTSLMGIPFFTSTGASPSPPDVWSSSAAMFRFTAVTRELYERRGNAMMGDAARLPWAGSVSREAQLCTAVSARTRGWRDGVVSAR